MRWLARRVAGRAPTLLLLAGLGVVGLGRLSLAVLRRPVLAGVLAVFVVLARALIAWGPALVGLGFAAAVLAGVLVAAAWSWLSPASLERRLVNPVRSARRVRHYRRAWLNAVEGCGLVRNGIEPVLMSVRASAGVDRLSVHLAPGQIVEDWRSVAPRLAAALEVRSVRVRRDGPRDVLLLVRWRKIRLRDPEVEDAAALDTEVAEVAEQLEVKGSLEGYERAAETTGPLPTPEQMPGGAFPRRRPR